LEIHVNNCLDGNGSQQKPSASTANPALNHLESVETSRVRSPTSIPWHDEDADASLAVQLEFGEDEDGGDARIWDRYCPLCGKEIAHFISILKTQHINRCLDSADQEFKAISEASGASVPLSIEAVSSARFGPLLQISSCPLCAVPFETNEATAQKSLKGRIQHLHRCAPKLKSSVRDVLDALRVHVVADADLGSIPKANQAIRTHEADFINSVASTVSSCTAPRGRTAQAAAANTRGTSSVTKKRQAHRDDDVDLAVALSASLVDSRAQFTMMEPVKGRKNRRLVVTRILPVDEAKQAALQNAEHVLLPRETHGNRDPRDSDSDYINPTPAFAGPSRVSIVGIRADGAVPREASSGQDSGSSASRPNSANSSVCDETPGVNKEALEIGGMRPAGSVGQHRKANQSLWELAASSDLPDGPLFAQLTANLDKSTPKLDRHVKPATSVRFLRLFCHEFKNKRLT
jgi:hypothetical protein